MSTTTIKLPDAMPADAESQVSIYRQYAADLKMELEKCKSELFELKANYKRCYEERAEYKLKWNIETERYNDLIEKMMDKLGG